tara:strand:+ start:1885 stop:2103 length:219 start_codon:yes stop_codon:yes gene_type:complete
METLTPKQYILNVLNQAMVSLQDSSDNDIMIPQLLQAVRFLDQCDVKLRVPEKPDTPDIDSIQERNYENRRT